MNKKKKFGCMIVSSMLLFAILLSSCNIVNDDSRVTVEFYVDGTYYNSVEMKGIDDSLFPNPSRYGNVFDGWYTDDSYTEKYVESDGAGQDIQLYGRFLPNEYTLTFVDIDGSKIQHKVYHGKPIGDFPVNIALEGITGYNWVIGATKISKDTVWRLPMDKEAHIDSYELCDYEYSIEEIENNAAIKINPQAILANIHTDIQFEALWAGYKKISNYKDGTTERSQPNPIRISFKSENTGTFSVFVSQTKDFENALRFDTTENFVNVYNLEIAKTYYYKVVNNALGIESEVGKIVVEDQAPRNLCVPGITNVRDIGGWALITLKKRIKQGMIYRTGKGDSVTEEGKRILTEDLGVRSEIDLRDPTVDHGTIRGASEKIAYYNFPINFNGKVLDQKQNQESIKKFFEHLADEDNYPVMYHCTLGRDRGGIVSILLGALLGMSENDLAMDYVFSNFENAGTSFCMEGDTMMNQLKTVLQNYEGETFNEMVYSFLLDIGLTAEQLETIRSLLIEEKPDGFRDAMSMANFSIEVYEEDSNGEYVDKTSNYKTYLQNNYFSPVSDYDITSVAEYLMPSGYTLDETLSELSLSEAKEKDKLKIYYKKN